MADKPDWVARTLPRPESPDGRFLGVIRDMTEEDARRVAEANWGPAILVRCGPLRTNLVPDGEIIRAGDGPAVGDLRPEPTGFVGKVRPVDADGPLRLSLKSDLPTSVRGREVALIAVGDYKAFRLGVGGCLARFKDPAVRYKAGRPEGSFFLHHFADRDLAIKHAMYLAEREPELIGDRGNCLLTTRGPIQLEGVYYADGGINPRVPDDVLAAIRVRLAASFPPARDSEGNRSGD